MQPINNAFLEKVNNKAKKRMIIDLPKGFLVRPSLADPKHFQRYHMLNELSDSLDNTIYKIRRLKRDMARGSNHTAVDRYALMDLEEEYQITLSSLKRMARNKI